MQLWIGALQDEIFLAIKETFKAWRITEEGETHICLELERSEINILIDALMPIIELMLRFCVEDVVSIEYPFLKEGDKDIVISRSLGALKNNPYFPMQQGAIMDRLRISLLEKNILNIDGFFSFRLTDISEKLKSAVEAEVSSLLRENEREELLLMLKNYAERRTPLLAFVRVLNQDDRYAFFDEYGSRIITVFSESKDYTPDEELINGLLYIAPLSIDLTGVKDPEMLAVLRHIFSGRIKE